MAKTSAEGSKEMGGWEERNIGLGGKDIDKTSA